MIKRYGRCTARTAFPCPSPPLPLRLIGSNGAGKTTALAIAAGLVRPDAERLTARLGLFDQPPRRPAFAAAADAAFPPESTARELMTYRDSRSSRRATPRPRWPAPWRACTWKHGRTIQSEPSPTA